MTTPSDKMAISSRPENAQQKPRKILVIEDDPDTRYGLEVRLAASNYEVVLMKEGENAVALAQKVKPDLITLDLGLPGIDGLTVLETLKKSGSSLPVIVLTAWDEESHEQSVLEAGARLYLQKPIHDEELLAAIDQILD